jgi:competence protein ComFC
MLFVETCAGCREPGSTLCRRCRFALASAPLPSVPDAAFAFDGVVRQAIVALKYRNHRRVAAHLALAVVRRLHLDRQRFDVVTWAPTSSRRSAQRGFDQSEVLARAIARELGVPCRRLLYRSHAPAQTGRGRAERLAGPMFRGRPARAGVRVLLIDDVRTTGATLRAAVAALGAAGLTDVHAVAVAAAGRDQVLKPAKRRTSATAGVGSTGTSTPIIPTCSAARTFVSTSSKNAVRLACTPSLVSASS